MPNKRVVVTFHIDEKKLAAAQRRLKASLARVAMAAMLADCTCPREHPARRSTAWEQHPRVCAYRKQEERDWRRLRRWAARTGRTADEVIEARRLAKSRARILSIQAGGTHLSREVLRKLSDGALSTARAVSGFGRAARAAGPALAAGPGRKGARRGPHA